MHRGGTQVVLKSPSINEKVVKNLILKYTLRKVPISGHFSFTAPNMKLDYYIG